MSRGFSLIELMIAMAVLGVGLLGGIVVIAVASANDGRSKLHSTAVTLAESTMEKIIAIPQQAAGADAETTMTDCAGTPFVIETASRVALTSLPPGLLLVRLIFPSQLSATMPWTTPLAGTEQA